MTNPLVLSNQILRGCITQRKNVSNLCNSTNNFIRWKIQCSIQFGFASLNRLSNLSAHDIIHVIVLIKIHDFYTSWWSLFTRWSPVIKPLSWLLVMTLFHIQSIHFWILLNFYQFNFNFQMFLLQLAHCQFFFELFFLTIWTLTCQNCFL